MLVAMLCSRLNVNGQRIIIDYNFDDGSQVCDFTTPDSKKYIDLLQQTKNWNSKVKPANIKSGGGGLLTTPDYFSENCGDNNGVFENIVGNTTSYFQFPQSDNLNNKFASILGSKNWEEGIIVPFDQNMTSGFGVYYSFSFDIAIDDYYGGRANDIELKAFLTKWGEHWESTSSNNVIYEIESPKLTISKNSTSDWKRITINFRIPAKEDGTSINGSLNHLVIKAVKTENKPVYIDNVEIVQFDACTSMCKSDKSDSELSTRFMTRDSVSNPTSFSIADVSNDDPVTNFNNNGVVSDLKIKFDNSMYYKVSIFDGWGGKQYEYESLDFATLDDVEFTVNGNAISPFGEDISVFRWWGTSQDGTPLLGGGASNDYILQIETRNCNEVKFYGTSLIYVHPTNTFNFTDLRPENFVDTVANCCQEILEVDNHIYITSVRESRNNYIHSALNGPVSVNSGTFVQYNAGNEVKIGSGFTVAPGGKFEANIRDCELNHNVLWKRSPVQNETFINEASEDLSFNIEQSRINEYLVYPNPVKSKLSIYSRSNNSEFIILDLSGREIHSGVLNTGSNSIDINAFRKGSYIIKINNTYVKKIIKY